MRASEYDRPIRRLEDFLAALSDLTALMEPVDHWGGRKWYRRKSSSDASFDRCWAEVSSHAGPAAEAFNLAGMGIDYKPPGTMQTRPVNPALIWSSCFGDDAIAEPSVIFTVGIQAVGHLKDQREQQQSASADSLALSRGFSR